MIYKQFGEKYLLRFERGDNYLTQLTRFATETGIALGDFRGIGSFDNCELGYYKPEAKEYLSKRFNETHEVVSLVGNLSILESKPYFHTHVTITDLEFNARGGHLITAIVGATLEIVFEKIAGSVDRKLSDEIGLNLLYL